MLVTSWFKGIPGGYVALAATMLVLAADVWLSHKFPASPCCVIEDHVEDLIAGTGVAIAFVLTYLAAQVALPSPGRQLLSSMLGHMPRQEPELAVIDEIIPLTEAHFTSFREFVKTAKLGAPNDQDVLAACETFMKVVNLSRPQHTRDEPTIFDLESLGYSHLRASFLMSVVFKKDAEKRILLRASVIGAIVFCYTILMKWLSEYDLMESSYAMVVGGYAALFMLALGFAVALALRMWPHTLPKAAIEAALRSIQQDTERRAHKLTGEGMDTVVALVEESGDSASPRPPRR
jgi:hypothetical protein